MDSRPNWKAIVDKPALLAAGLFALGALTLVGTTFYIYSFWAPVDFEGDYDVVEEIKPVTPSEPLKDGRKLSTPLGVPDTRAAADWLVGRQQADGSWPGQPDRLDDVAVTALCVEGLLA